MALRDDFEQTAQEFYDAWYRFNPVEASWLGIHAYDDQLGDLSADGIQEQAGMLNEFVERLAAIPRGLLPVDLAVDYEVVAATLRAGLWSIEKVVDWQRNPMTYVQEPLFGLLVLSTRDYAPIAERANSALSRLEQLPGTLDAGRVNVTNPPRIFVETAIQAAGGGAGFVREVIPRLAEQTPDLRDELLDAADAAARAFDDYAGYLKDDVLPTAEGDFSVGRERFEELLQDWHMHDVSADELATTIRRLFEEPVEQH